MADKKADELSKQCNALIKKCFELDRAMVLSKKADKDLTEAEAEELIRLAKKINRWCMPTIKCCR